MRIILLSVLVVLVLGVVAGCRARAVPQYPATIPAFHQGTEQRHERFNAISKEGKAKLVFLGDSITQGWENEGKDVWKTYFEKYDAANFGIGGDRTEHILWRLDNGNFDGLSPKLVVLMIGTNNTGARQDPPEQTAAGIEAIIQRLRTKCPNSKVLLLAIFPRDANNDGPSRQLNSKINALLPKLSSSHVRYRDIGHDFLTPAGELTKEIMPDLLHLSPTGYELWAKAIEGDVAEMMK